MRANVIFVTGGLGPTSDDFTRECVAKFVDEPLEWNEPSWQSILERLASRGASFTENQKQQCFYPRGATILRNANGTANGFIVTANDVQVITLPGPPSEIEVIWKDSLSTYLQQLVANSGGVRPELTLLRTMGLGEGALASRIEQIIDEAMNPEVRRPAVGYRAHAPYVEIKLWSDPQQAKTVAQVAAVIRREFSEILVNEGTDDVADRLLSSLATESAAGVRTLLIDRVTNGELAQRLYARADELKDPVLTTALENSFSCVIDRVAERPDDILKPAAKTTVLGVSFGSDDLKLIVSRGAREKEIELPKLASSLRTARGRKWAIELALSEWGRH